MTEGCFVRGGVALATDYYIRLHNEENPYDSASEAVLVRT